MTKVVGVMSCVGFTHSCHVLHYDALLWWPIQSVWLPFKTTFKWGSKLNKKFTRAKEWDKSIWFLRWMRNIMVMILYFFFLPTPFQLYWDILFFYLHSFPYGGSWKSEGEGGSLLRPFLGGGWLFLWSYTYINSKGGSVSALWSSFLWGGGGGGVKSFLFWGEKI